MRTVIIANGDPPSERELARWLHADDLLICADGGARVALQHQRRPQHVIGDFDSLSPESQSALRAWGTELHRHPPAKDETDLELALSFAVKLAPENDIVILGAMGGRIDHALANMLLLAMPDLRGVRVSIVRTADRIMLIDARQAPASLTLDGAAGDTVSLLPFGGDAHGIRTEGLRYALKDESLFVGPARGVSNVLANTPARVHLSSGMLLCIVTSKSRP